MRIEELYSSQQLNEGPFGPYGVTQKMKDATVAKAKGVFGGGQREQGNMAVGAKANDLYKDFKRYIGQVVGSGHKYVEAQHLINWIKSKKMDPSIVDRGPEDFITPSDAQKYIMAAARKNASGVAPQANPEGQPTPQEQQPAGKPAPKAGGPSFLDSLSPEDRQKLIKLLQQ